MYANGVTHSLECSHLVDEVLKRVRLLIEGIPKLGRQIGNDISALPAWRAMVARYESLRRFRDQGMHPPMVVTLFGPSGAGKSSVFRWLTGLPVPAGDIRRPTTYHCVAAVPKAFARLELLQDLFPNFRLRQLEDPRSLAEKTGNADTLFYAPFETQAANGATPLVVTDVPDFNTVEEFNWKRAERMLVRSELVIFLVYHEAYADDRCMQQLAQCARLAGDLVCVFTKTRPEAASTIWEDLLQKIEQSSYFEGQRQDGQTLREFLRDRWFYFSPRSEEPQLGDIQAITPGAPDFSSLFVGATAQRIVLAGFLQSSYEALRESQAIVRKARELRKRLRQNVDRLEGIVKQAAENMTQNIFPLGRMLELIHEECQKATPWWIRPVAAGFKLLDRWGSAFVKITGDLVNRLRNRAQENSEVKELSDAEQSYFEQLIERVIKDIRDEFPEEAVENGLFSARACQQAREEVLRKPLPAPMEHWEQDVRDEIRRWINDNPWLARGLTTLSSVLKAGGIGLIVVDLGTTGGILGTTIGTLAGAGGASLISSWLMEKKMTQIAERTKESWSKQRSREVAQHVETYFLHPLTRNWRLTLDELNEARINVCEETCETLTRLLSKTNPL